MFSSCRTKGVGSSRFRLTWGIIKYQPHDPHTDQGRSMEGTIEAKKGVKSHAHGVDISHSSILLPVCGATAKGEASNQPKRPRVLGAVEGVLLLKAPAFPFRFADGIFRCSRSGSANLACGRGEPSGKMKCGCSTYASPRKRGLVWILGQGDED